MKIIETDRVVLSELAPLDISLPTEKPLIPAERYAQRIERLRDIMRKEQINHVLVYADREHYYNFRYLMGYDPRFEEALLVVGQERVSVILGNECFELHKLSPIPVSAVCSSYLSLPNQPMEHGKTLEELFAYAGVREGEVLAAVGWKMFTRPGGAVRRDMICVPSFVIEAVKTVIGATGKVLNGTDLFVHPEYGMRVIHDVDAIAALEYGAAYASEGVKQQLSHVEPGMTEAQLANYFRTNGQVLTCHPFALAGENTKKGMINSSDYVIKLGDGLNLCAGLEGGLTCRHAYVAYSAQDLPEDQRDYIDALARPYYAAVASWYENMKIGVCGGDIYNMIQEIFPAKEFGWILNPGHLCSNEEWQSSPFYAGSTCAIKSGMILQMDIIPARDGYDAPNCEDGVCIADETLRAELQKKYPDVFARMQARRNYMIEELGICLPNEVLPMSNLAAQFRPYVLNRKMGLKITGKL